MLEQLAENESLTGYQRQRARKALARHFAEIGGSELLEKKKKEYFELHHGHPMTPFINEHLNNVKEAREWLLSTRNPALFRPGFNKKVLDAFNELKEEYGEKVNALVLVGGRWKGHDVEQENSDVDANLLTSVEGAERKEIIDKFDELLRKKGTYLCRLGEKPENAPPYNYDAYFQGLVVGDREKLREAQRQILQKMTHREWEWERQTITRAASHLKYSPKKIDLEDLQTAYLLNHVPPKLNEAKKQVLRQ